MGTVAGFDFRICCRSHCDIHRLHRPFRIFPSEVAGIVDRGQTCYNVCFGYSVVTLHMRQHTVPIAAVRDVIEPAFLVPEKRISDLPPD
jgi:hypothetical protein